jgi:acetoin utilization deacetylase AcuC-like enzyme
MASDASSFSMASLAAALQDTTSAAAPPPVQHDAAAHPASDPPTATAIPDERSAHAPPPQPPAALSIVWDPRCLLHLAHTNPDNIWDDDHQKEQPGRLAGIVARLRASGRFAAPGVVQRPCAPASHAQLLRAHSAEHLAHVAALDARGGGGDSAPPLDDAHARALLDDAAALTAAGNAAPGYVFNPSRSVYSCDYTPAVAALAAGGVCAAVDDVATGAAAAAFAVVRPPGHHCSSHGEGGFCWLNNVAVGVRHAQDAHGVRRVAILDWDIHHGDGTQAIFAGDPSVLLVSLHRYMPQRGFGFYPGTGSAADIGGGGGGRGGNIVNVPLPYFGCGDHEYAAVMEAVVLPLLAEWAPELVVISCGFDAAHGDPLGGMHVTPGGYAHLTAAVAALDPPRGLVVALEGGYNVDAISASADAVVGALLARGPRRRPGGATAPAAPPTGVRLPPPAPLPPFLHPAALQCIRNVAAAQAPYFACMAALDADAARALLTVEAAPSSAKALGGAGASAPLSAAPNDAAPPSAAGSGASITLGDADCVTPCESRPSSASVDEAAASQPPPLLPRHEFDHQALRRWDYGKHVAPAAGEHGGWVSVTYARPHFPPKKFAYTDSPYAEPVVDCHVYALLAPAAPELTPPGAAASEAAAARVAEAVAPAVSVAAAAASADDDGLGGLSAALGSLSVSNASSSAPAVGAPPAAAAAVAPAAAGTPQPPTSGNHLTPAAGGSPAAAPKSGYRTRSQAKEEQRKAALSSAAAVASATASGGNAAPQPAPDDAAILLRAHAVADEISAAAAPSVTTTATTATAAAVPATPVEALPPKSSGAAAAAPAQPQAAVSAAAAHASPADAPAGAFWKPLGPCQAWVAVEHWHPTREAALAAVATTDKKPAAASGGGRRSSGAAAVAAAASAAAPTALAVTAADAQPLERHFLVVTDMLGRTLLRLKLRPGGVKGGGSSSGSRKLAGLLPPALAPAVAAAGSAAASTAAAEPGKRAPPLTIPARVVGPEGVGLFPNSSSNSTGDAGAGGEWTLLDGADADDGLESRVLVAPGCAAAVGALHADSTGAAALPPVGWVPVVPTSRADALQHAMRAASEPGAAATAPLPPCFRRGDYAPLALRLYFGDERDDDKVEKGQWTGRPCAADFHNLLARYAVGGAPSR